MQQTNGSDSSTPSETTNKQQRQQQPPAPVAVPQQWIPMQYPTAAMVMPHHMMPPQHYAPPPYVPYHHHHHQFQQPLHVPPHQHQNHQNQHGSNGENKTLWIGDLHSWMDESYLHRCFASTGEVVFLKHVWFLFICVDVCYWFGLCLCVTLCVNCLHASICYVVDLCLFKINPY